MHHAIQIKWDGRTQRYVAMCKRFPDLLAFGASILEAQENMKAAIARFKVKT